MGERKGGCHGKGGGQDHDDDVTEEKEFNSRST